MVQYAGPAAKKRKTTASTTDEIAQANSTAQLFAAAQAPIYGQQINGMANSMSGGVQQTVNNVMPEDTNVQQASVNFAASANAGPAADQELMANLYSTAMSNSPTAIAPSQLVTYDTPSHRRSLDHMARTSGQPGLPSPALTEGNMRSPVIVSPNIIQTAAPPSHLQDGQNRGVGRPRINAPTSAEAQKKRPGRPSQYSVNHVPGTNSTFRPNPQTVPQHQRVPSQTQPQPMAPPQTPNGSNPQYLGQPRLQPATATKYQSRDLHPHFMIQKLNAFKAAMAQRNVMFNPIDQGRLILLGEAIAKEDWFYITLSQLHALSSHPSELPQTAKALVSAGSFQYLDTLLSNNGGLTGDVLIWLQKFPMSLVDLLDSDDAPVYRGQLQIVVGFLAILPQRWDNIVTQSKIRQSPPLVEEMYDFLGVTSRILQTTIFRAISRIIWENIAKVSSNEGIEALEQLHLHNQQYFFANMRRSNQEIAFATQAFKAALVAWQDHLLAVQQHNEKQPFLPVQDRTRLPKFCLPNTIVQVFNTPPSLSVLGPQQMAGMHPVRPAAAAPAPQLPTAATQVQLFVGMPNVANGAPPWSFNATRPVQRAPPMSGQEHIPMNGQEHIPMNGQEQFPARNTNPNNPAYCWLLPIEPQPLPPNPTYFYFPHELDQPRPQPAAPDPIRSALHQAHLKSPILPPLQIGNNSVMYRYVHSYAVPPTKVDKDMPISHIQFEIDNEAFSRIPPTGTGPDGSFPRRHLTTSTRTYRLRCIVTPKDTSSEKQWVEADNFWPENLYINCNDELLETRRKLHHNLYLPIDITSFILPGTNELTVCVDRTSTDNRPFDFAIAIEVIGLKSHEDITNNLTTISATESLAAIKKSLSSSDSTDDIAITSSNTIIKLFDPFYTDRMVTTPVRGAGCLHRDCFDLETFLSTCKREQADWPTVVDCWRCPICRGDVRPQTLVRDGFLVAVRRELERAGLMGTRAVVVNEDGTWVPKVEERKGVRSPSVEREERGDSARGSAPRERGEVEVIELD
ncbi:hypothetical protein LTR09_009103 [Extremus antarcticus]|uniref:SP-RING-type domain-containing protein n=1 Tax=Extremus antarcticus TaxID=702011 RepID=A0AAJ0D9R1_9PEZI|nr:hypothetical protein LTR09_009103 [Extremus antarcticus]